MDINKIKVLKKAIEDLEKEEKKQKQFLKESIAREIKIIKKSNFKKNKYEVVYKKPVWKKKLDRLKDKILFFLWKMGIYR